MRYFDSGVLVKLYRQEPNSAVAVSHVRAANHPIVLTPLHVVEIRTALRLMVARAEITGQDCLNLLTDFELDRSAGQHAEPQPSWDQIFSRSEQISAAHTSITHCRSLDTIHVALAIELGATEFCTFDRRQAAMAGACGLVVIS